MQADDYKQPTVIVTCHPMAIESYVGVCFPDPDVFRWLLSITMDDYYERFVTMFQQLWHLLPLKSVERRESSSEVRPCGVYSSHF